MEGPRHTAPLLPHSTCPWGGGGELKSSFQNACLRKTASLHLFPCCGKSTLNWLRSQTGPTAERCNSAARKNPEASSRHPPSLQHIRLQLCGNMPGLGAAARTVLAPMEEASCCGPKSFLKVHTGSFSCCQYCTFSLARFLALLSQSNSKALSCSFLPMCCVLFSPQPLCPSPL